MVAFSEEMLVGEASDEFNEGVRQAWTRMFEEAKNHMEYEMRECAKDAWDLKELNKGDKQLLCSVPTKLYRWCQMQYGEDCWRDRDFIECYQRYMQQTFLPKPSSTFGK